MNIVQYSNEDFLEAKKFIEDNGKHLNRNKRDEDKFKYNVIIGRIGEMKFAKMHPDAVEVTLGEKKKGALDFILDGKKIDVKTIDSIQKNRVFFKADEMNSDLVAVMQLDQVKKEIAFRGFYDLQNVSIKHDSKLDVYYFEL